MSVAYQVYCLNARHFLPTFSAQSIDLIVCSPPYENCRLYGEEFPVVSGEDWVKWAVELFSLCLHASKAVVWVVEGKTSAYRWSSVPALLMADLHRAGVNLRKPPIFMRHGIPGSGGPDYWRNDYEFCIFATSRPGKLPWSYNCATGKPCKYRTGGKLSHRTADGRRINREQTKNPARPEISNPGNVIHCKVGGGLMGSKLAHENEAPFPESLVEPFVKCFCPPGGTVCDPFCGSGTTAAVAIKTGRNFVGCDIRQSQVDLTLKRILEASSDQDEVSARAAETGPHECS